MDEKDREVVPGLAEGAEQLDVASAEGSAEVTHEEDDRRAWPEGLALLNAAFSSLPESAMEPLWEEKVAFMCKGGGKGLAGEMHKLKDFAPSEQERLYIRDGMLGVERNFNRLSLDEEDVSMVRVAQDIQTILARTEQIEKRQNLEFAAIRKELEEMRNAK